MESDKSKKAEKPPELHLGHRKRIRSRYLSKGIASLDDTEIIELILTYAIPRMDVYNLSHRLIEEFGSADGVLSAGSDELMGRGKLSENTAVLFRLIDDIRSGPYCRVEYSSECLVSVKAAVEYCSRLLRGYREEAVIAVSLSEDSFVTEVSEVSVGSDSAALLPVDRITESAVRQNVRRLLIAHNHPSGSAQPSSADISATNMLKSSLAAHRIELVEHIIVAGEEGTAIMHHQTIKVGPQEVFPWKYPNKEQ